MIRITGAILCLSILVLVTGCPPASPIAQPLVQCPGKGSVDAAAASLQLQRANLHPIRASARCVMEWTESDGKQKKENVDTQLRFVPPDRLFVRGDKFGEIRFGTNEEAFWFMVKPELDTYWWGTRQVAEECAESLHFNPWHVTEALGITQVDTTWTLDYHGGYDILTKTDAGGNVFKKIWIRACDYQITSIEQTNPDGSQAVHIQLSRYTATKQGLAVPTVIEAKHLTDGSVDATLRVELRSIRLFQMPESKQQRLFARPPTDNYETVYRLASTCDFVVVGK